MAKSKATKPKAVKPRMVQLPKGFRAIEHLGNFWRGEKPGDSLTGKLVKVVLKKFPANKKLGYAARTANVYTIEIAGGKKVEVTQSGGLGAMQDVKKGQTVYIGFMGMKPLPGKSPMREYVVAVQ